MTGALLCLVLAQQPSAVVGGVEAFGEYFPRSTQHLPGANPFQQSVLTGPRFSIGYSHHERFRVLALVEGGYAAAGIEAGNGDDGFMAGMGVEAELVVHRWLIPFLRISYDVLVAQRAYTASGTLTDFAVVAALGVRALRFLDVDFIAGRDFAGGWAVGLGVALGWSWLAPLK